MPTPYRYLRCGDLRSPGTSERRNGPLGLRDDDDDWDNPGIPPFVLSMGFTAPFWQRILHGLIGIGTFVFCSTCHSNREDYEVCCHNNDITPHSRV